MTELHEAVALGHFHQVDEILKEGLCDPNCKDPFWGDRTPLHWAAAQGHSKIIKLLAQRGARLCLRSDSGWTAAHFGAERGQLGALKTLHSLHAPVDAADPYGDTPRRIAQIYGHKDCVDFLEMAEAECKEHYREAKQKGIQLDTEDGDWRLKKEERLKNKLCLGKNSMKKGWRKRK